MEYVRKKLLLDVDDVIVDGAFLDAINKFKGTNYKESDFNEYYIEKEILSESEIIKFRRFIIDYNIYENCRIMDGCKEALEELNSIVDIYICSSCVVNGLEKSSGILFARKYDFLLKEFPFIDPNKIIFTSSKNNFMGFDYQVDDRADNLEGDIKYKILFTRQHNKNIDCNVLKQKNIIRVKNWYEILNYIKLTCV